MRQLTAETRIRVRPSLSLPRKRELTGETRIRLSQIKDLKDWALEMAQDEAAPEGIPQEKLEEADVEQRQKPCKGKIKFESKLK